MNITAHLSYRNEGPSVQIILWNDLSIQVTFQNGIEIMKTETKFCLRFPEALPLAAANQNLKKKNKKPKASCKSNTRSTIEFLSFDPIYKIILFSSLKSKYYF